MPSFSITNIAPTSATINVVTDPAYPWYRVFVRKEPWDGLYIEEGWYQCTDSWFYIDVTGMEPSTTYAVNVLYNTEGPEHDGTAVGTQYFVTKTLAAGGKVYIGGAAYIPYIYQNGEWQKASPYIYADGWQTTEGK